MTDLKPLWRLTESRQQAGWLTLLGPYDAEFVQALKDLVLPRNRQWCPTLKAWRVHGSARSQVEVLIRRASGIPDEEPVTAEGLLELARGIGSDVESERAVDIAEALSLVGGGRLVARKLKGQTLVVAILEG